MLKNRTRLAALATVLAGFASTTFAAPIFWTNPAGNNGVISYSEGQSDKGLYGEPTVTGSKFSFLTPSNFFAEASNGSAQTTSDRVSFKVAAVGNGVLDNITIHEVGDWSILGGTASVKATGALILTNGSQTPTPITPTVRYTNTETGATTTVRPNGESDGIWVQDYIYDLPAGVTSLTVVLNNILQAASTPGTTAFIQKKGVEITLNDPSVPEPASITLIALGAGSLIIRRRRAV